MRLPSTILCFWLTAAPGALAAEALPALREGMAYSAARGLLLSRGFKPVPSSDRDSGRCSAGRQDVCGAYPETVSCSGTGTGACRFIFSGKDGAGLTIVAAGQDAGRLKVVATRRSAKTDTQWQRAGR